jgi:hypothetical protein
METNKVTADNINKINNVNNVLSSNISHSNDYDNRVASNNKKGKPLLVSFFMLYSSV